MNQVRAVLQTVRIHALAFSLGTFLLMGWLGGARGWLLVGIGLLGVLYHGAAYARGAVADYKLDILDPAKKSTPWVTGELSQRACWMITLGFELAFWPVALLLGWGRWAALVLLVVGIIAGNHYVWWGKRDKVGALVSSSVSYGATALAVGLLGGPVSWTLLEVALYIGLAGGPIACIASGEIKDMAQQGEDSLLRRLGVKLQDGYLTVPGRAYLPFGIVTGVQVFLIITVAELAWGFPIGPILGIAGGLFLSFYLEALLHSGRYDRARKMKVLNVGTAMSFIWLVVVAAPALGLPMVLLLLIGMPGIWVLSNRFVWGSEGLRYGA